MEYNISKSTPPGMPNLVRGTKCMLFLLSKVSKDMHQSIVPILFSLLESHASGAKFMRPDQKWEEMCGMMGNLMADRRRRKGPTVMTRGSHLPRLPTARGGGPHEDGRTHPIPQHARGGDDRPRVRRLPQDRQVVHLTRGKAHSRLPGRTVMKLGLPNSMWNRTESYDCPRRLSYLCRVIGKRAENHFPNRGKIFF